MAHTDEGIVSLVRRLQELGPQIVVLEATGGYEIPVAYAMSKAGLPVVIMNPKCLRHFAKSTGKLAKTDKLDVRILAHYAKAFSRRYALKDSEQMELANIMSSRRQLRDMMSMEENRRRISSPKVRGKIDQHLAYLRQLL